MSTASNSSGDGRQRASRRPLAVDLFAGAGGLSLGLEQAGFDVAAAVEYDPVHAAAHEFNFPLTKVLCADVSAPLTAASLMGAVREGAAAYGHEIRDWDGELDLIAGGPPCQGFSSIGKRLIDDRRNQLVFHFFRLVSELQPRYFVMENVPGMAKGGHAGILSDLVAEFEGAGYRFPDDQKYRILNAADYGVPQERHRLFLIGTRRDQEMVAVPPPATVNPVPKRSAGARRDKGDIDLPSGPTVWDAIGDLPNLNRFSSLSTSDEVRLSEKAVRDMNTAASPYGRWLRDLDSDPADLAHPRIWDRSILTSAMRTLHTEASVRRFRRAKAGETEPVSRFYRLDAHGLCNTLRAGSGSERGAFTSPRPLHPVLPRVLSNREAARLHSFPDWFRLHVTKWHGFRQIGNAVAPLVGRAVGGQIIVALGVDPPKPSASLPLGDARLLTLTMGEAADYYEADRAAIPPARKRGVMLAPQDSTGRSMAKRPGRAAAKSFGTGALRTAAA